MLPKLLTSVHSKRITWHEFPNKEVNNKSVLHEWNIINSRPIEDDQYNP